MTRVGATSHVSSYIKQLSSLSYNKTTYLVDLSRCFPKFEYANLPFLEFSPNVAESRFLLRRPFNFVSILQF